MCINKIYEGSILRIAIEIFMLGLLLAGGAGALSNSMGGDGSDVEDTTTVNPTEGIYQLPALRSVEGIDRELKGMPHKKEHSDIFKISGKLRTDQSNS